MFSTVAVAWRTMIKRLLADWLIIAAVFMTVILAVGLLASGPIYADAVTISALQRTLADAPVTDSSLTARINVFPENYERADQTVRSVVEDALSATGAETFAHIEAEAFGFAEDNFDDIVDLPSFQYFERIDERATLLTGRWPASTDAPFETALNSPAADALGLEVGDSFVVVNRREKDFETAVSIVGIYQVNDPSDAFWFEDALALQGQVHSTTFRTLGPFVVARDSMLVGFTPGRIDAGWRILPDYDQLAVSEVNAFRASVEGLDDDLNLALFSAIDKDDSGSSEFTVTTGLPGLAADVDRSLTVTRSSVLSLLVQLALLAGYALVLTAGLLVDTRRSNTTLLRSRGASPGQVLATSLLEGLVLTVPAVIAGPYLATWLLRILNVTGPLAAVGLRIDPVPTREAYVLATLAAVLSMVVLTWPAFRSARSFPDSDGNSRRQVTRSATQRLGVDIALVALAAVAFWQLQELGPLIGARVRGRFGIDPLLVLAPALGLLAGAIVALRIVPLLARLSESLASASRWTVSALASWQVARRPVRYARSALLLMIAIAIGFFAASYSTTWISSQRDQAAHAIGADIRVLPDKAVASSLSDVVIESAHLSIDGVDTSMPVSRVGGRLRADVGLARFILLDAAKADDVVSIRDDISPDFRALMDRLVAGRPHFAGIPLPGEPVALAFDVDAKEEITDPEDLPPEFPKELIEVGFNALVSVILQDGNSRLHRVVLDRIPVNEGMTRLTVDLSAELTDGLADPVYPLSLVNIEIESQIPFGYSRSVDLDVDGISVTQHDGSWEWATTLDREEWTTSADWATFLNQSPAIALVPPSTPDALALHIDTGAVDFGAAPAYFSLRPDGTVLPDTFPVVLSRSLVDAGYAVIGQTIPLPPLRIGNGDGLAVGTVESFPTVNESETVVIVDLPTFQMMDYEPGYGLDRADEYWLGVSGDREAIVASLETSPLNSLGTMSTDDLMSELVSDPVALGTIGALTVGFVAAAVFAAVGFAVSATVSARERLVEFALLRALGLSPRQLGSWLIIEQGALVVASLVLGTAIGVLLTAVILPLVTLTQGGGPAVPAVIVLYPWPTILALELAVLAVLAVIVLTLTSALRRVGLGSMLRLGED